MLHSLGAVTGARAGRRQRLLEVLVDEQNRPRGPHLFSVCLTVRHTVYNPPKARQVPIDVVVESGQTY